MPGNAAVASGTHSGRNPTRDAENTVATDEPPGNVVAASDRNAARDAGDTIATNEPPGNTIASSARNTARDAENTIATNEPPGNVVAASARNAARDAGDTIATDEPPGNAIAASARNASRDAGDTVATDEPPGNVVAASDQYPAAPESMSAIAAFRADAWTREDPRLPDDFAALTPEWRWEYALRTDYARRQALVEIDMNRPGNPGDSTR